MSEEDGTADCSHMILAPLVSSVFCYCTADRGARAPELPLPRTQFVARGGILQRTPTWRRLGSHLNSALELPLPRTPLVVRGGILQRILTCNALSTPFARGFPNTALELPLPRTPFVESGIPQRIPLGNVSAANFNTALESSLLWTHSVVRGGILQRIFLPRQRPGSCSQSCCGGLILR